MAPDDPSEIKATARQGMENAVASVFRESVKDVTDDITDQYEVETEAEAISNLLSFESFLGLPKEVSGFLETVFTEGAEDQLGVLEIDDTGIFDLIHEDARAYAEDRAAELVGRQWVGDTLVDNPDARWAITDSTRSGLRSLIERAYSEGMSPAQLKKEIKSSYAFSDARAKLIAKTETSKASIQGSLTGWERSGVVSGKSSLLSDDHDHDDECDDNEADGVIALDEDFSSGDDGPPYHPGCNCSLVAELSDESDLEPM